MICHRGSAMASKLLGEQYATSLFFTFTRSGYARSELGRACVSLPDTLAVYICTNSLRAKHRIQPNMIPMSATARRAQAVTQRLRQRIYKPAAAGAPAALFTTDALDGFKVLAANRGEIAIRVLRAATEVRAWTRRAAAQASVSAVPTAGHTPPAPRGPHFHTRAAAPPHS